MLLTPSGPTFSWLAEPPAHSWAGSELTIEADPGTDFFIDPAGSAAVGNAPLLLAPLVSDNGAPPLTFSARARAAAPATFDAAALYVVVDPVSSWAKLALERSPQGRLTVVTVVTNGVSDDANHHEVENGTTHLRITALGAGAFAFHSSPDGREWALVRYFRLIATGAGGGPAGPWLGLSAQSPAGQGCRATFDEIRWSLGAPTDLRDGS
jgi:regulation of enolase protein 1 (concanavalin A-like superfamily)